MLEESQPTVFNVHSRPHRAGTWRVGGAAPNNERRPVLLLGLDRRDGEVSILFEPRSLCLREYRVLYIIYCKQISTSKLYMWCDDLNFWLFFNWVYCLLLLKRYWQTNNLTLFFLEARLHYQSLRAFEHILLLVVRGLWRI